MSIVLGGMNLERVRTLIIRGKTISAAHFIAGHPTCGKVHGHNYELVVGFKTKISISDSEAVDFHNLSQMIDKVIFVYDHNNLGDMTCETLAEDILLHLEKRLEQEETSKHSVTVAFVELYETPKFGVRVN